MNKKQKKLLKEKPVFVTDLVSGELAHTLAMFAGEMPSLDYCDAFETLRKHFNYFHISDQENKVIGFTKIPRGCTHFGIYKSFDDDLGNIVFYTDCEDLVEMVQ